MKTKNLKNGTIRQQITSFLQEGFCSAKDLSSLVKLPEKEIFSHLEHVAKSVSPQLKLVIQESTCLKCGFSFKKRSKLHKPGKCPQCREQHISSPRFMLVPG